MKTLLVKLNGAGERGVLRPLLCLALAVGLNAGATTYYIDYGSGSDSNNGLTTGAPWKRHPYDGRFAGSYSHADGDRFIFRGGVVYDVSGGTIGYKGGSYGSGSGSRYNPDYYGVDASWYSGGSWSRPIFDGGGGATCAIWIVNKANLVIDGFWFRSTSENNMVNVNLTEGIRIANCVFSDVKSTVSGDPSKFISGHAQMTLHPSNVIDSCYFTAMPGSSNAGMAIHNFSGYVINCVISNMANGILINQGMVSNCNVGPINISFANPVQHENVIQQQADGALTICYCRLGPCYGGSFLFPGYSGNKYVFNNVIFDSFGAGGNVPLMQFEGDSSAHTAYVYNNTFVAGTGAASTAMRQEGSGSVTTLYATNNHFIGTSITTATPFAAAYVGNSVSHATESIAASDGYARANFWKPSGAGGDTVDVGRLVTLFANDKDFASRPAGAAWDVGAYEYSVDGGISTNAIMSLSTSSITFGPMLTSVRSNVTITITNIGAGLLVGTGTVSAPFWITNNVYTCATNATTNVVITYAPNAMGVSSANAAFTGGGGGNVSLTGLAYTNNGLPSLANKGLVTSGWTSNGNYIVAGAENYDPAAGGLCVIGFSNAVAGNYYLQFELISPDPAANSFWWNTNSDPNTDAQIFDTRISGTASNQYACWRGPTGDFEHASLSNVVLNLAATNYTLYLRHREANCQVGQVSLVSVASPSNPPPTWSALSGSKTVVSGQIASFTGIANGVTAYTWTHAGTNVVESANIDGQGKTTLNIWFAHATNAGNYQIVATNDSGSITSQVMVLTVTNNITPPTLRIVPTAQRIRRNFPATLFAEADGTEPKTYAWFKDGVWKYNGQTLSIESVRATDLGEYSVVVENQAGAVTSNPARIDWARYWLVNTLRIQ